MVAAKPGLRHLFISYASEDWAAAEWLTLKLTAAGYAVWCDRFKLLGGEQFPLDIRDAIANQTCFMLALLSRSSVDKASPQAERALADRLRPSRGRDFIIPICLDDLPPEAMDVFLANHTQIIFHRGWAAGFAQLLQKLEHAGVPRSKDADAARGDVAAHVRGVQARWSRPETWGSNLLPITALPEIIHQYRFSTDLDEEAWQSMKATWCAYELGPRLAAAFEAPPTSGLPSTPSRVASTYWQETESIEGVRTTNIATWLIRAHAGRLLERRGLARLPKGEWTRYFPLGAVPADQINFTAYSGKESRVTTIGEAGYGKRTEQGRAHRARHHLSVLLTPFHEPDLGWYLRLRIGTHWRDMDDVPLPPAAAHRRRRKLAGSWRNHQWYSRYLAVAQWLADDDEGLVLLDQPRLTASASSATFTSAVGIDDKVVMDFNSGRIEWSGVVNLDFRSVVGADLPVEAETDDGCDWGESTEDCGGEVADDVDDDTEDPAGEEDNP